MLKPEVIDLRFYFVLSFPVTPSESVLGYFLRLAIGGGVTAVQLRLKNATSQEFVRLAKFCRGYISNSIQFIINDRVDLVKQVGADGVHLGQTDMPVEAARQILGRPAIIGLSIESEGQLLEAAEKPIDYVGISPVYRSRTKSDLQTAWGLSGLRKAVGQSRHPCVAIGGINCKNIADIVDVQPAGIAVCSAILHAELPVQAIQQLKHFTDSLSIP